MTCKYPKPKILLVDMPEACAVALEDAGFNIHKGTFGRPYKVKRCDSLACASIGDEDLPNIDEQEILIANALFDEPFDTTNSYEPGEGVSALWQSCKYGVIDPRPIAMEGAQRALSRMLEGGGLAIVFAGSRYQHRYWKGADLDRLPSSRGDAFDLSNWSFLSELNAIRSLSVSGNEIEFTRNGLAQVLARASTNAEYLCTLSPGPRQEKRWLSLAKNKYGECVAAAITTSGDALQLIVLPRMPHFHEIIVEVIRDWCPRWRPKLFPHLVGTQWLYHERYDLPLVTNMRMEIERVQSEAAERVALLERQIEEARQANPDWYTLLTGTGDELVDAVIRTLGLLGFQNVADVDAEADAKGEQRREDIQIRDTVPVLIVDVKGVNGKCEDAEATQSEKHALMRAKEFAGNVKPLTIMNPERNLPPHERDPSPFRLEIVENAKQTALGLMTTWDLFRLLRNKEANGWSNEVIQPVFYRTGRIEPIPEHYTEVGSIVGLWKEALGIVPSVRIEKGCRMAIEAGDLFQEVDAGSLMVDGKEVAAADIGSNCGIACKDASKRFRKGMRVFLVRQGCI